MCRAQSSDCSPRAVEARVLDAFSSVRVLEVLECVSRPSAVVLQRRAR